MSKRFAGVLIAMVLVVAAAGALWATQHEGTMPAGHSAGYAKEFDRCTMTCTMLMNHYNRNFGAMKAHEGDKQCWHTCWSRFGSAREEASTSDMKELWMRNRVERMRANQCAQACWRIHNDSSMVEVGGWRSAPRDVVCTP